MIVNMEQLKPYINGEADLIPLNIWNKQTIGKNKKVVLRGKTPLDNNWTKIPKDNDRTLLMLKKGYNVGYRIPEDILVIDVDPRNFKEGEDSLQELCMFLGIEDLADKCPTVVTGSGGYHYYLNKPTEIHLRETIDRFPGIEFKTVGRQVVCAGSKHPNGKMYEWDDFSPDYRDKPSTPKRLIKLLEYIAPENQSDAGTINGDQLSRLLVQIPIEHYADNDSWFRIMCASHHGTAGLGIEEFLHWSLDDMDYEDDEHTIRCRWSSLSEKTLTITVATLYKEVLTHGGQTGVITASEDFKDFDGDGDPVDDFDDNMDTVISGMSSKLDSVTQEVEPEVARQLVDDVNKTSSSEYITKTIRAVLYVKDVIWRSRLLDDMQKKSGMSAKLFSKIVKEISDAINNKIDEDMCRMLAELSYRVTFNEGNGLIYSVGEQFWRYNGKYWGVITKRFLEKKVTHVLDKLREKMEITRSENSLVMESATILSRIAAVDNDALGLTTRPKPIINCQNGELWVGNDGAVTLRPHRAQSYLLQVLNVTYEPAAECPLFDAALLRTFSKFNDRDEMIELVWEMIGYIIQPNKDLEKWFLFNGTGGDGKSTIIRIVSSLLGNAVLPESVNTFATDNHVMSDVPGKLLIVDDDMDKKTKLPDGIIKKLCGRNDLNGNPKGSKTERFTPATTLILSCNGLPRTDDLTEGGRRRPIVIPFNMSFHNRGQGGVLDMGEQIIDNELNGVLNKAIEGLKRLRKRERFTEPKSSVLAKNRWIAESNMNAMFVEECIDKTDNVKDTVMLRDMYAEYNLWCETNNIRNSSGKQHFRQYMEDLGLVFGLLGKNIKGFRYVKIRKEIISTDEFNDFE